MAIIDENMTVVRYLVEHGADVNARGDGYGHPLHEASFRGYEIIVCYLVEHGADVNVQGGYYGNPLQAAATTNLKIVQFLVKNGADVNAQGAIMGIHFKRLQPRISSK
jgi:ankyrin repeat protein